MATRDIYDQAVRLPGSNQQPGQIGILAALFALLSTGVNRGCARRFWLILVALILHVLAAGLQLEA